MSRYFCLGPNAAAALVFALISNTSFALYWKTTTLWPEGAEGQHLVRVCWDPLSTGDFQTERLRVRETIESTWSYYGNIDFWDWGDCPFGILNTIVINQEDGWSYTPGLGTEMYGSMRLNFTWSNPDPPFVYQNAVCVGDYRNRCEVSTALHEFGHSLGFEHEFDRPDSPANDPTEGVAAHPWENICWRDSWDSGANASTATFDQASIMNYPSCGRENWQTVLSQDDISGLLGTYGIGRRYLATIVVLTGP